MVKAIINISDHANQILNIIKAKYGLKDKSEAINIVTQEYESKILETKLRPSYVEKANKINKEKSIKVGSTKELRKRYG